MRTRLLRKQITPPEITKPNDHHEISSWRKEKRLPRGVATVNAEIAASHEAAGIADQENSGPAVLLGLGETAKHVLLGPLVAALGVLDEQILDHLGHDVAGGDSVDADAIRTPLGG